MSDVMVHGIGAVSPGGWTAPELRKAWEQASSLPATALTHPNGRTFRVLRAPSASAEASRLLRHPRLRRSSPISQFALAACTEALGQLGPQVQSGQCRLGVILCVMAGCIAYTRRFYDEVLRDASTASPLIFPETVFNAPASHLSAFLGQSAMNYTLVGDPGMFLQGLACGAKWLASGEIDACVIAGAEEADWPSADAFTMFNREATLSEGAGAVCLVLAKEEGVILDCATDAHSYGNGISTFSAAERMRQQLPLPRADSLLLDGVQGIRFDQAEESAWQGWNANRWSVKRKLGEGLAAGSAWQCVLGIDALRRGEAAEALISVVGCHQQAIGAVFRRKGKL